MKISRKSWHYRWLSWWLKHTSPPLKPVPDPPNDLCSYFWLLVYSFTFYPVGMLFICILMSPFAIIFGLCYIVEYLWGRYIKSEEKKEKKEWLATSWLRAKKQKVCPLIEWEE